MTWGRSSVSPTGVNSHALDYDLATHTMTDLGGLGGDYSVCHQYQ